MQKKDWNTPTPNREEKRNMVKSGGESVSSRQANALSTSDTLHTCLGDHRCNASPANMLEMDRPMYT